MYSTSSSGQFSTASSSSATSSDRRDQITAPNQSSSANCGLTTPSAYLTYAGIGASTASISAASYLPSIIDNNNIEESFVDISSVPVSTSSSPLKHRQQSGFVPPIIDPIPHEPFHHSVDQTQPQNLSVNRVGSETGTPSQRQREGGRGGEVQRREQYAVNSAGVRSDNNNRSNVNNNLRKQTKSSDLHANILRNTPPSNGSMVTGNTSMTQLSSWHIPNTLAGNPGSHQAHPHQTSGQQQLLTQAMSTPQKQQQAGPRRHTGPRPPKNEMSLSPEEAERRRVRRERNKLAAAKCRKRRMDHTAQLQEETEELESVQREIHSEILNLQQQKEQLEFILQAHKVHCKRGIPITTLPPVRIPALTLPAQDADGELRDELASNVSNDSLSSTTSNHSPAPSSLQMTTTTAAGGAGLRSTNSGNGVHAAPLVTSFTAALNNESAVRFAAVSNAAAVTAAAPAVSFPAAAAPSTTSSAAAANRPTSLPIIVKQEPPFLKVDSTALHQHSEDVKPEAMDISVTQATGVSISTPKVSPRVLSLFDVIDHTGLTPITGGGVIASVGSASNTPISSTAATAFSGGDGGYNTPNLPNAPPTTKMETPTDRNNATEKPNSSGQSTLMSL